jgi:Rrf2 family protein
MRLPEGVEWGLHCLAVLAFVPPPACLPARRLAEYHDIPEPYLAKSLQALVRAGLVESVPGARGGYRLAHPPAEITVLDAVLALDGPAPAFRCTEIRQRGPASGPHRLYRLPCAIHAVMQEAEAAWRARLAETSIADIALHVMQSADPTITKKAAVWLQEVLQ